MKEIVKLLFYKLILLVTTYADYSKLIFPD